MPSKNGKCWRGVVKINGVRTTRQFDTKREAVEWEIRERERRTLSFTNLGLNRLCDSFLANSESQNRPHTVASHVFTIRHLLEFVVKDLPASGVSLAFLTEFIRHMRKDYSPSVVNRVIINLKTIWKFGMEVYDLPANPATKLKAIPYPKRVMEVPTAEGIGEILENVSPLHRDIITTYILTGAREQELYELRWEDIDFNKSTVCLFSYKIQHGTRYPQEVPMTDTLREILERRMKVSKSEFVFPNKSGGRLTSVDMAIRSHMKRRGKKWMGFHKLRYFFGSTIANATGLLRPVQLALRHKNLRSTECYAKHIPMEVVSAVGLVESAVKVHTGDTHLAGNSTGA